MKVTIAGLVLLGIVLTACLMGNQRLNAGWRATRADSAAIRQERNEVESTEDYRELEGSAAFLQGVEDWHKLEGWFRARAGKQREELKGASGAIDWSGAGIRP